MKLEFSETFGRKVFRIDDREDDAPMIQIQFFNEFGNIPYEIRAKAAKAAMFKALEMLASGVAERESNG